VRPTRGREIFSLSSISPVVRTESCAGTCWLVAPIDRSASANHEKQQAHMHPPWTVSCNGRCRSLNASRQQRHASAALHVRVGPWSSYCNVHTYNVRVGCKYLVSWSPCGSWVGFDRWYFPPRDIHGSSVLESEWLFDPKDFKSIGKTQKQYVIACEILQK
jgi:hypothetical protein